MYDKFSMFDKREAGVCLFVVANEDDVSVASFPFLIDSYFQIVNIEPSFASILLCLDILC